MYNIVYQEQNKIEIALSDSLSKDEFIQIIHQLESLCTAHPHIHVLFDASTLQKYNFKLILDEYDFYKKYKDYLERIAIVSDLKFESFILQLFNIFSDLEIRSFSPEQIDEARRWIFPSRLPR
jgi:hypothetical protein